MLFYARRFSFRGRLAVIASLALLTAILGASAVQAYERPKFNNVSGDEELSIKPKVAQDTAGNVHVVWDSDRGSRQVQYAKGTWNGSEYTFGPKQLIGDVGGYQYATPNVFVGANNQVMVAWSNPELKVKVFAADQNPPAGPGTSLGGTGITPSISADYNDHFHVAWNGDFKVQYCEFADNTCVVRETFPESEGSLRPDISVDDDNNVHLVWEGDLRIRYRTRVAGAGGFGPTEQIGPGVFAQVAADGKGGIHIVSSNNYNAVYCRKTLDGPCVDSKTFDFASDLEPSIGATRGGNVAVVFRDDANDLLALNVFENGAWTSTDDVAGSTTQVDVSSRPYTSRFSFVWGDSFDIQHASIGVAPATCDNVVGAGVRPVLAAPAQLEPVAPFQVSQLPVRLFLPTIDNPPPSLGPPTDGC